MSTKKQKKIKTSKAKSFMEKLTGGHVTLGKLLESIRLGEEQTQREFSSLLDVSISHLNDIEKGRKAVSPERAARFAKLLGYSESSFVELAVQDMLSGSGLSYKVQLKAS